MKERMLELIEIINEADYNYHTLDNPTITDQEYDKYLRELIEIEEEHPEWLQDNSPTQHAGGKIIEGFEKVNHKIPMMSLSNVFSESEIIAFDEKIKKEGINPKYMAELKIDGLSVSLLYDLSQPNSLYNDIVRIPTFLLRASRRLSLRPPCFRE